jgi:Ser/Thr protein kinase RdoA (MazF antagonist)
MRAEPLPPLVAEPAGDPEVVRVAAARAARAWALPEPVLVRLAMNGVFTAGDDLVLRVGRPSGDPLATIRVADAVRAAGVRAPDARRRDAFDAGGGLWVTAWERIHPTDDAVDWERIGAMVAAFHDRESVADVPALPWCGDFPWWRFDSFAPEVLAELDQPALDGLVAALERGRDWQAAARQQELVVCHGDVHPGNVLMDAGGPVLLDWDLVCIGPRGWDHAPLMSLADRWGGDPAVYEAYAAGYGRSMVGDAVADALAELRLVAATLMRVRAGRTDPSAATEAAQRLRFWRGDPDAPPWRAQ